MINKKRQELIVQNLGSISAEVRIMSIEQLVQLPTMPAAEKLSHLEKVASDPDEGVRTLAAAMIKSLRGTPAATGSALPVSAGTPPVSLPEIDSPVFTLPSAQPVQSSQPSPAAQTTPAVKPSPAKFMDDPLDPSLPDLKKMTDISNLFQHIKFLATKKPSGHITQLLQLSCSMLEEVALTALQALVNLKDGRVTSQILVMLADEQYSSQRRFLMLKIILDTDTELDSVLLETILLREKDVIVKSGLVKVFARSSRESGIPTLVLCLQDEDPRVRANTVEVIEEQNIKGCEQNIVQLLEDPENRVKVNAAKYLVKNGFQQAFLTLRAMLVSPEVWLRDSVIFALGEIGDQASLTLLKAALKDPNQGIRLSVLKSLARINNNTSRQVLKAACGDPDPVLAQVANSLCEKIKDTPMREEIRQILPAVAPAAAPTAVKPLPIPAPAAPATPAPSPVAAFPESVSMPSLPSMQSALPAVPGSVAAQPLPRPAPALPIVAAPASAHKPAPVSVASPTPASFNIPSRAFPATQPAAKPPLPVAKSVAGMPAFSKPRSAGIYERLCSPDLEEQRAGARDIAFVMGDDQMVLIEKAAVSSDESIRIAAVKLLSRKRTPDAQALLQKLTSDANETIRSLAEKALQLLK